MKNLLKNVVGILLIAVMLMYTNVSIANNDYTEEQNQKQENNNKIQEIQEREKKIESIKDTTLKEVEKLNLQISQYESQIASLDEQISATNKKIEEAQAKLEKAQEDFDKQEKLLKARLIATYEAGETSYLDVLLSSENLTDFISNYYLISELATYDAELLEQIEKEKKAIADAKETLENGKQELETQRKSKQSISMQLQTSKNSKNKYVSELSSEQQELQAKVDELKKDNEALDAKIRAKQAAIAAALKKQQEEAAKKASQSNSSSSTTKTSGSSTSASTTKSNAGFIKPVNSYVTTGMYYSWGGYHGAVDFGAAGVNGMPVYAVADGIVVTVETWTRSYGNHIIIAHSNGLYTLYAHGQAGSISVSEGQSVKQGQQIMRVGSTGNSTGPHLHFEVRTSPGTYNCRVNPMSYLP